MSEDFLKVALAAKEAAAELAPLPRAPKDAALRAIADALVARSAEIVAANALDVEKAGKNGISEYMVDRLRLDEARVEAIAEAVRQVADLPDPVGEVIRGNTLPNGLELRQLRVPLGVIGIIYEGRPNVTVDAAALCLKSGNATLLRGSSSAYESNTVLVRIMQEALADTEVPAGAVQLVPGLTRESVKQLMRARGLVDVLIPRGGASLINSVVEESTVPVIETGVGNCHVYVDADADQDLAIEILINSRSSGPRCATPRRRSWCTPPSPTASCRARSRRWRRRGDGARRRSRRRPRRRGARRGGGLPGRIPSLDIAAAVVDSLEDAVAHIRKYGSGHTDAIVTRSVTASRRFVALVDSAAVAVNASTRFTDGGEFGFGAEIGISTQKLHARGPMGLPELTSTKWVYTGEGHLRTNAGTVVASGGTGPR
ncbi:glutamate-5-semialdehyde dehydrogenase [Streptosporangium lutulentum]